MPDKIEALSLPTQIQDFLRHKSNFRLTPQGILVRIWIFPNGEMIPLIVVGYDALLQLIADTHEFKPTSTRQSAHLGQRKTMTIIASTFYSFNMRRHVNKYISSCAICKLNSYPRTQGEKEGEFIATEPNQLFVLDFAGPYAGWAASASGTPRYVALGIDAFSRYVICHVTTSTSDEDVFRTILEIRRQLCGLPARISVDNALLRANSKAAKYLEANQIRTQHGLPFTSRCQSKAERAISSISRLFCKYASASPELTFSKLVEEAVLAYNSAPNESLPNRMAPRDVHFNRAPSTFTHAAPKLDSTTAPSIRKAIDAARKVGEDTLANDVAAFIRRKAKRSPTNYSARIHVGDLLLKRRSSFPANSPRKLAYKIVVDCFECVARIASNNFRCVSLVTGDEYCLSGDVLVKIRGHTRDSLVELCKEMERVSTKNATLASRRVTRSMTNAASNSTGDAQLSGAANISAVMSTMDFFHSSEETSISNDDVYNLDEFFQNV